MADDGPDNKRANTNPAIGTHDGSFHCDEALACYLLKCLPRFKNSPVIRTRDPVILETCEIVVDVGGVFDAATNRYDHHQRSFSETMKSLEPSKPWNIKLSSAGLVYKHFGRQVIAEVSGIADEATIETVFDRVYENLIQEVDAIDNGVNQTDDEPKYRIKTSLSSRVGRLNPAWNDQTTEPDAQFAKAMAMVGEEFEATLTGLTKAWLPARHLVVEAINNRTKVHASGKIVEFDQSCPWKSHLYDFESEHPGVEIVYVLYPDSHAKYRVQCVSVSEGSFENRKSLPEPWRGVRDQQLSDLSGIPGCIFVHASGFIGGNATREGALQMAVAALEWEDKSSS